MFQSVEEIIFSHKPILGYRESRGDNSLYVDVFAVAVWNDVTHVGGNVRPHGGCQGAY